MTRKKLVNRIVYNTEWYKPRTYPHFDFPLEEEQAKEKVEDFVANPASHGFLPLLFYKITEPKFDWELRKRIRNAKVRPIAYPSHTDAAIYAYYSHLLNQRYEVLLTANRIGESVLAYRTSLFGKSNLDFACEVFAEIAARKKCTVMCLDITDFFGSLNHDLLKLAWARILDLECLPEDHFRVYRALTKIRRLHRDRVYKYLGITKSMSSQLFQVRRDARKPLSRNELRQLLKRPDLYVNHPVSKTSTSPHIGISQGTPMSAMLSNIYMLNVDIILGKYANEHNSVYRRYSDDIVLISPENEAEKLLDLLKELLSSVGLSLAEAKTQIIHFDIEAGLTPDVPLAYLGLVFDGQVVSLKQKSLNKFYRGMKRAISNSVVAARAALRKGVNSKIHRREIYENYSHLGQMNYVKYAYRAEVVAKSYGLNSICRRQVRRHWLFLYRQLRRAQTRVDMTNFGEAL